MDDDAAVAKKESAWSSFLFILLCGVFLGASFFKVPPAIPMLMQYFQCDTGTAGWMMSSCSVAGTLIAFFTGSIQAKIGPKNMVLAAMAWTLISILTGVLCGPNDIGIFMVSQFVGGLGNGFIATGAPALFTVLWKDPTKRGFPNSIWACWTAFGSLIMLNAYAGIVTAYGSWQAVWWFAFILVAVCGLLGFLFIKVDKKEAMAVAAGNAGVKVVEAFKSIDIWLIVIMFFCFAFGYSVWAALAPTYMQMIVGMDMATANSVASITTLTGIVGSLFIGIVLNKVKNQPLIMLVCMILAGATMCFELLFTTPELMLVMAVFVGLFLNICPPCFFSNVQWASPSPSIMGAAFGMLAIGSNFGGVPAASTVGAIVDATHGNWAMGTVPLLIVAVVGIVCAAAFAKRNGEKASANIGNF